MLVLDPAALRELDDSGLEELLRSGKPFAAVGEGEVRGIAAATLLFADYALLTDGATLHLDTSAAWAAAAWRTPAFRLHVQGRTSFTAEEAREEGLVEGQTFHGRSELAWDAAAALIGRRELAWDAAAALIGRRGGDALERAVFALLFASGEPQEGLKAFLQKRQPSFRHAVGIVRDQERPV